MTTHATPNPPRLDLRLPAGSIEIELEPRDTTSVELTVISGGEAGDAVVESTRQELRGSAESPELLVHVPERSGGKLRMLGRQPEILMRVIAPLGSSVRATGISADIRCAVGAADVVAKSVSADVTIGDCDGDVKAESTSGDVRTGGVGGRLHASSVSGDISTGRVGDDSRARTMSGSITLDGAEGSLKASSMSGDVAVRSLSRGEVELGSMSGDIEAAVDPGVRVFLDLRTLSGDARSSLEATDDAGRGGAQLTLKADTKSGDVTVKRTGAAQPQRA